MTSSSEQTTALIAEAREYVAAEMPEGDREYNLMVALAVALEAAAQENARIRVDGALAELLTAPRVVSTVAELDALPLGTVARETGGPVCLRVADGWRISGFYGLHESKRLALPATVLWVGGTE